VKKVYLIAAGGTGGHIVPAIAVAEKIRELEPASEIFFCGVGKEIERKLIPQAGFELEEIPFPPFRGRGFKGVLEFFIAVPSGLFKALRLIKKRNVSVVFGFGGYPSFSPIFAAWLLRRPRLLHEQNQRVGLANKVLSLLSTKVFSVTRATGFPSFVKCSELPLPVRRSFRNIPPIESAKRSLLVIGGSQGAKTVNSAVLASVPTLKELGISVVHQTGPIDKDRVEQEYAAQGFSGAEVLSFIDNVSERMTEATLIISRAGAMSVAEISAARRPAIYVPLAIAGGHQRDNCKEQTDRGAALLLEQDKDLGTDLEREVRRLFSNPELLDAMAAKLEIDRTAEASEEILAAAASELARGS